VKYIHRKLQKRYDDSYDNWDERSALHHWALVCGASAMDGYLFNFVLDEMRLHHKQTPSDVAAWQQTLCHLISFMLRHGMPMERLNPRPGFHEEKKQARNSEEALLAALNSCAQTNESISNIEWLAPDSFGNWILTLQKQRTGGDNLLASSCLSYLNLQHCILNVKDFYRANFVKANLAGARLFYANLIMANLAGANLERAYLRWANLAGANLAGANLAGANLAGAHLEGAHLEGANLAGANLAGARLEGANLKGTILEGKVPIGSNEEVELE